MASRDKVLEVEITLKEEIAVKISEQHDCSIHSVAGRGTISFMGDVTLSSPSFMNEPPTFTLFGDTSGGLPTDYTWTRDGTEITNNGPFNISIAVHGSCTTEPCYRSTLTVTGNLPGAYQYIVSNRLQSGPIISSSKNVLCKFLSWPRQHCAQNLTRQEAKPS